MKQSFIILIFILTSSYTYSTPRDLLQKQVTAGNIQQLLLSADQWVKYPAYSDRTGWNNLTCRQKESIIKAGESSLSYKWEMIPATAYLEYERSGSRKIMEDPYGNNCRALGRLLFAELAEGKGRFMNQLINGVWAFCDMPSWVLSAHLPVQASRRNLPDFREQIIDLGSSDMGAFLSWTWYFMHFEFDKINPVISLRLEKEIRDRILDPYMKRNDYWWQALEGKPDVLVNNWNPWCNSNVLTCYLLLEKDPQKKAAGVYKTIVSTDQFINYVKEDGACEEGPSYWSHAAGKLYDYLEILFRATNGRVSIYNEPIVKKMGEYIVNSYVGNDWVVNFADASAKGGGNAGLIYRYGKAINSIDMLSFSGYLYQQKKGNTEIETVRDFFRTIENILTIDSLQLVKPGLPEQAVAWYPQTEFLYQRNNDGLFLACKGGFNNESHNHNDAGSFSLWADGIPFFIDAGVGTYTRQTFGRERYTIWTMQSAYHNLPAINGFAQQNGAEYKVKNTRFDEKNHLFSTDIAGAYPKEAGINNWTRSYSLNAAVLTIRDEFSLQKADSVNVLNFLVWAKPAEEKPGIIRLQKDGTIVQLQFNPKLFLFTTDEILLTDKRLSSVWGEKIYRIRLTSTQLKTRDKYQLLITKMAH